MVALGLEQAAEEGGGAAHLLLHVEAFEVEHRRHAMLPHAPGDSRQLRLGAGRIDGQMPVFFRQRDEIAFRIDDDLLHQRRALLQQAAQQMRLARAGIALHQQARRQQFLEVETDRGAARGRAAAGGRSHIDGDGHWCCESVIGKPVS